MSDTWVDMWQGQLTTMMPSWVVLVTGPVGWGNEQAARIPCLESGSVLSWEGHSQDSEDS